MAPPWKPIWEQVLIHVIELAPWVEAKLEQARRNTWFSPTVRTAQVNALMVAMDMDLNHVHYRNTAERFCDSLLDGTKCDPHLLNQLPADKLEKLREMVTWIGENFPLKDLDKSPTPDVIRYVSKKIPILGGFRGYRWLNSLGYRIAVPDHARQRFLLRMGWIDSTSTTLTAQNAAFKAMQDLARNVEAPLSEVDLVIGVFSGADGEPGRAAARCVRDPLCEDCPVADQCPFGQTVLSRAEEEGPALLEGEEPATLLMEEGSESLSDVELVSVLLKAGITGDKSIELARRLLHRAESIERLSEMSVKELMEIPGMGAAKACAIHAAFELSRRLQDMRSGDLASAASDSQGVFDYFWPRLLGKKQEHFYVLLLNAQLEVSRRVLVSKGELTGSVAHAREVFSEAVRDRAYAVVLVHNHPSGNPSPSPEDKSLTERLVLAGKVLGIEVLDHVIIGNKDFYSFADASALTGLSRGRE